MIKGFECARTQFFVNLHGAWRTQENVCAHKIAQARTGAHKKSLPRRRSPADLPSFPEWPFIPYKNAIPRNPRNSKKLYLRSSGFKKHNFRNILVAFQKTQTKRIRVLSNNTT